MYPAKQRHHQELHSLKVSNIKRIHKSHFLIPDFSTSNSSVLERYFVRLGFRPSPWKCVLIWSGTVQITSGPILSLCVSLETRKCCPKSIGRWHSILVALTKPRSPPPIHYHQLPLIGAGLRRYLENVNVNKSELPQKGVFSSFD